MKKVGTRQQPADARPRRFRRVARALAMVVAVPVVLVLALVALLALNPSVVLDPVKQQVLPRLSQQYGREISVGDIGLGLFPPRAEVKDLSVGSGPVQGPPLAQAKSAALVVELWPLVRSLGKDVQIRSVVLKAPELNLVRGPDGRWNYEGLAGGASEREIVVERVRIDGGILQVVDGAAGGERAVALRQVDATLGNLGLGREAHVRMKGALASGERNLEVDLRALAGTGSARVDGKVSLDSLQLERLRSLMPAGVAQSVTGGALRMALRIGTNDDGTYSLNGDAGASRLMLRGNPAEGRFALSARIDPGRGRAAVELRDIRLNGAGVDLGGTASLVADATGAVRARFDLKGPLLQLDTLLAALPQSTAEQPPADEPLVPASMRRRLRTIDVSGRVAADRVVNGKLAADNVVADVGLRDGVLVLRDAQAGFYGGRLQAAGTRIRLDEPEPSWNLKAQLESVDLGLAFQQVSGVQPLRGKLSGALDLRGAGHVWEKLRQTVTGAGGLKLGEGALTTADIGAQLAGPVQRALQLAGQAAPGPLANVAGGTTPLQDLSANFAVEDGWLRLARPMGFRSSFGTVDLGGGIALDKSLDLRGHVNLSPQFVADVSGGRVRPDAPLQVPLTVGGGLASPAVQPPPPEQIAAAYLKQSPAVGQMRERREQLEREAREQLEQGRRTLGRDAGRRLQDILGK